jgi:hypothetical protein
MDVHDMTDEQIEADLSAMADRMIAAGYGAPTIVMAHNPRVLDAARRLGYTVPLAGIPEPLPPPPYRDPNLPRWRRWPAAAFYYGAGAFFVFLALAPIALAIRGEIGWLAAVFAAVMIAGAWGHGWETGMGWGR